jgi:hypothetical protein
MDDVLKPSNSDVIQDRQNSLESIDTFISEIKLEVLLSQLASFQCVIYVE